MEIKIQSIHFDATESYRRSSKRKSPSWKKTFEDIKKVEVQLKVIKPATALNKEAGITVTVPGLHCSLKNMDSF